MNTVSIGLVQYAAGPDRGRCYSAAAEGIETAAARGARVVCLPELFAGPYPCQHADQRMFDWAEPIDGDSVALAARLAVRHSVVIVAPIFERRAPGLYHNTAVVIDADGSVAGVYRKMHIPDDVRYREKFYFAPGDTAAKPVATRFGKLGIGICWDQWFPEFARLQTMSGADVLLYPSAIGWSPGERTEYGDETVEAWVTSMRGHAIANGIHVAAVNRVGREDEIEFWGHSVVISPLGKVAARASETADEVLVHECGSAEADPIRTHWPFLRDRRPDAYSGLVRRWND